MNLTAQLLHVCQLILHVFATTTVLFCVNMLKVLSQQLQSVLIVHLLHLKTHTRMYLAHVVFMRVLLAETKTNILFFTKFYSLLLTKISLLIQKDTFVFYQCSLLTIIFCTHLFQVICGSNVVYSLCNLLHVL